MKYEIELHIFHKKLNQIMIEKGIVDKKGKADPIKLYNLLYPNDQITEDKLKLDRQLCTDKTRKVQNWIQGKNYPKSISDILSLCNALDCDLDYFFTDMECPTHDLQFIHKETGLSETSIKWLQHLNELSQDPYDGYDWTRDAISGLNALLDCDIYFSTDVLGQIPKYCKFRDIVNAPNKTRRERNEALEKFQLALFVATKGLTNCIENFIYKPKGTV